MRVVCVATEGPIDTSVARRICVEVNLERCTAFEVTKDARGCRSTRSRQSAHRTGLHEQAHRIRPERVVAGASEYPQRQPTAVSRPAVEDSVTRSAGHQNALAAMLTQSGIRRLPMQTTSSTAPSLPTGHRTFPSGTSCVWTRNLRWMSFAFYRVVPRPGQPLSRHSATTAPWSDSGTAVSPASSVAVLRLQRDG